MDTVGECVKVVSEILYGQIVGGTFPELPRDEFGDEARRLVDEVCRRSAVEPVTAPDVADMLAAVFTVQFSTKYEAWEFEDVSWVLEEALRACRQ